MARMVSSAAALPLYTLDLARRYWAPLLCVYAAGTFLHSMMMRGIVRLGLIHPAFGLAGLSMTLLVTLATIIVMFHLLRPGLPVLDRELRIRTVRARGGDLSAAERTSFGERERRVVDAIAMAILPFLIFYTAWGIISEEVREYAIGALNREGVAGFVYILDFENLELMLPIALGAWCVGRVVEWLYNRTQSKWLGILTAVFESAWVFFALASVSELISRGTNWATSRAVWLELQQGFLDLVAWFGSLVSLPLPAVVVAVGGFIAYVWQLVKDGLFEPLLWLTIAAVVFGAEVDKTEALFRKHHRAEQIRRIASRIPRIVSAVGRVAGKDYTEKYRPFLNALRLILSVSPLFYLSFCLYYVLMELGFGWLERGVLIALGPEDFHAWWWQWLGPIEFIVNALHELLRICLLAATFEVILRRLGGLNTGRRARSTDLAGL